jgi:3-hydroxyisobutyrate dehydrogenase
MVGGKREIYEKRLDIFRSMGKKIFYCGRNGNGEIVKVINNCFAAVQAISTCEGLAMGVRAGVDFKVMCDVIGEGTGATNFLKTYGPMKAFRGDYEPGFTTELMLKDIGLAVNLAKESGVPFVMGALAYEVVTTAVAVGLGKKDFSAIVKMFEDLLKVRLKLE